MATNSATAAWHDHTMPTCDGCTNLVEKASTFCMSQFVSIRPTKFKIVHGKEQTALQEAFLCDTVFDLRFPFGSDSESSSPKLKNSTPLMTNQHCGVELWACKLGPICQSLEKCKNPPMPETVIKTEALESKCTAQQPC